MKNVILADARITGYNSTGAIVGYNDNGGTVTGCHALADVTVHAVQSNVSYHGGIAGFNDEGTVTRCTSAAALTTAGSNSRYFGGIAGYSSYGTVTDCIYLGTTLEGASYVGAIVGSNYGTGTVETSYFTNTAIQGKDNNGTTLGNAASAVSYNNGGTIANCGPAHTVTLGESVTLGDTPTGEGRVKAYGDYALSYSDGTETTLYSTAGSTIALAYSGTPAGYTVTYTVNGEAISGSTFTMPDEDVTVSVNLIPYFTRTVDGYGTGNGKWAFIASPVVENIDPSMVGNLLGNVIPETDPVQYDFDFYRLNPTNAMWENYNNPTHQAGFNIVNGQGYLYATNETKTLVFSGTFNTESSKTVELSEGFNLVGNPFIVNAYVSKPFYQMNADGTDIEPVANYDEYSPVTIPPCYGVVVSATGTDEVTFSSAPDQQSSANNGNLQMTLTRADVRNDAFQDKAIVSFNADSKLEKFIFNENHAKLYIPQDGNDYAIAFSDMTGEVPLNFRATETGKYTIGFNFENVKGVRIQLIDKLEDRIIDLKAIDNYTFMGSTADRKDRFTLVFTQVETGSIFAYQSGNDIIVSGDGELQVFDVMGRMVMTQHINGVGTLRAASVQTGVYILRLNGKSQKIVIK